MAMIIIFQPHNRNSRPQRCSAAEERASPSADRRLSTPRRQMGKRQQKNWSKRRNGLQIKRERERERKEDQKNQKKMFKMWVDLMKCDYLVRQGEYGRSGICPAGLRPLDGIGGQFTLLRLHAVGGWAPGEPRRQLQPRLPHRSSGK